MGAQLDWLMDLSHSESEHCGLGAQSPVTRATQLTVCVLGFTPVRTVAPKRVAKWSSTFASVLKRMLSAASRRDDSTHLKRGGIVSLVLTPTVGPEAVRGSTRLKVATAHHLATHSDFG